MLTRILKKIVSFINNLIRKIEASQTTEQKAMYVDAELRKISEDVFKKFHSLSMQCVELEGEIKKNK